MTDAELVYHEIGIPLDRLTEPLLEATTTGVYVPRCRKCDDEWTVKQGGGK